MVEIILHTVYYNGIYEMDVVFCWHIYDLNIIVIKNMPAFTAGIFFIVFLSSNLY